MKINKNEVLNALKTISSFTSPGGVSPVLGCTMFTFTPQTKSLRLMGTDLNNYYISKSNIEIFAGDPTSTVDLIIDTKIATNIINTFTAHDINVTINTGASTITFSVSDAELTTPYMSADDFPVFPVDATKLKTILKTDDKNIFNTAFKAAKYCVYTDPVAPKPIYTGVHIIATDSYITVEATDGKRAARTIYANAGNMAGDYLIPPALLARLPEKKIIEIKGDETFVGFKTDTETYYTRFIEGKFPDVSMIIPKDHKIKVEIGASKMIEHIKFIEPIAKDNSYSAKLNISKNGIKFSASAKNNKAKCEYKEAVTDGELDINFNIKFLREMLTALQNEKTELKFTSSTGPVYISEEKAGVDYHHVLMPVKPAFTA